MKEGRGVLCADGADRLGPATRSSFDDEMDYPLDPPLEDVRIPVSAAHANATGYAYSTLMDRFVHAEIGYDLHMLFSEPSKAEQSRLAPDVLVARKVSRSPTRDDYDADLLGPPDFVLEVLSQRTWTHDLGRKLDCYQRIGVRECLLFDTNREDRAGTGKELWGFAMTPESRAPLEEVALPNGKRGIYSAVLGLAAYVTKRTPPRAPNELWALEMRWHDLAAAEDIPDYDEVRDQVEQARAERARREAKAERARRKAEQREKAAAQREAGAERARREAERRETEAALRRVAELEEQLRRLRDGQ